MLRNVAFITMMVVQLVSCSPQLITAKDGKIGVNFGGYHAEAGLGGLVNGNGVLGGGLSASAGTPHGQSAAAGIGGSVDGQPAGGAYAGATAGGNVGAEAGISSNAVEFGKRFGGVSPAINTQAQTQVDVAPTSPRLSTIPLQIKEQSKPSEATIPSPVQTEPQPKPVQSTGVVGGGGQLQGNNQQQTTTTFGYPQQQNYLDFQKQFGFGQFGSFNGGLAGYFGPGSGQFLPEINQQPLPFLYQKRFLRKRPHNLFLRKQYYPVAVSSSVATNNNYRVGMQQELPANSIQVVKNLEIGNRNGEIAPAQSPGVAGATGQVDSNAIFAKKVFVGNNAAAAYDSGVQSGGNAPYGGGFQFGGGAAGGNANGGTLFDNIFNIPIATLRAVNQLLNGRAQSAGGFAARKSIDVQVS